MKLKKNEIEVSTNDRGEINSIIFKGDELLHQGEKWWAKTYPMIWPVVGISNGFEVNEKNYELPKHGFWKALDWKTIIENDKITQLAAHFADDLYPFTIDIQNSIWIDNNSVHIKTTFTNLSKEDAYFHFGHHPAFKIDEDTKLETKNAYQKILLNDKLSKVRVKVDNLTNMEFGQNYDTLVSKSVEEINETLHTTKHNITIKSKDFENVQLWKPKDAKFVCIEPWNGWNDPEYDAPRKASEKLGIIKLPFGGMENFEIEIMIK